MLLRRALVVLALSLLATQDAIAQTPTERPAANGGAVTPRTPDGRPDLQGVWSYATVTPLERPADLADRSYLSDEEAAAWVAKLRATRNSDIRDPKNPVNDLARETNDFWQEHPTQMARINGRFATALIVEPPNGRVPVLAKAPPAGLPAADNPEDRLLGERCLFDSAGPPIVGNVPNSTSYLRIVQTPTHVVLHTEVSNTARIIPVGTTRERDPAIRLWRGASIGRWEANTLVIDSVHFKVGANLRGYGVGRNMGIDTGADMHLIERFSLSDENTLRYEFTVHNPTLFAQAWTAQLPMVRASDERMFENACHEGNHGLEFILRGARAEEKEARPHE
jgi:hypothetical protein